MHIAGPGAVQLRARPEHRAPHRGHLREPARDEGPSHVARADPARPRDAQKAHARSSSHGGAEDSSLRRTKRQRFGFDTR